MKSFPNLLKTINPLIQKAKGNEIILRKHDNVNTEIQW